MGKVWGENSIFVFSVIVIGLLVCVATFTIASKADIVYKSGKIYVANRYKPWVEAVAIKNGKFIRIGSNKDVTSYIGSNTEIVDLKGKVVLPGLIGVHVHSYGMIKDEVNLRIENQGRTNVMLAQMRKYATRDLNSLVTKSKDPNLEVFSKNYPCIIKGKLADMFIVDSDIFEIPIGESYKSKILRVVINGKVVYDRSIQGKPNLAKDKCFNLASKYFN